MAESDLVWDPEAEARINKAPIFVRKMARGKVEKAARALGEKRITVELLERIKKQEMAS